MRSLYLRIWLTVIVSLALFAGASGWLVQRHLDQEHARNQAAINERIAAWGDLIQRSLPAASAPPEVQSEALRDWSQRLRVPMALEDEQGHRIAASDSFIRREGDKSLMHVAIYQVKLDDGRSLYVMRPNMLKPPVVADPSVPPDEDIGGFGAEHHPQAGESRGPPPFLFAGVVPRGVSPGLSLLVLVVVLFLAIAMGAYPFVRRLTRRLETLKRGVEAFGRGALDRRVEVEGRDEVATLATSFNLAAERIEALVRSHKSLLANASHELRSPLARLKMATSLLSDAAPDERERENLRAEINTDIAELDGLVDEVLLASRLEAAPQPEPDHLESVDLLALAVEEGARVEASVDGAVASVRGEERLLRRALRNLLENARRYGGGEVRVDLEDKAAAGVEIRVSDNGPGVPEAYRERIFEPFFRLPGHAERAGGVGLGLALVRQIVERHHGRIRCVRPPEGGGCFVINLPATRP